jgi:hypothetical protein
LDIDAWFVPGGRARFNSSSYQRDPDTLPHVAWWSRWRKRRAIEGFLTTCGPALLTRYGREEHYSTARILATLAACGLSGEFTEYAFAMFASQQAFVEWSGTAALSAPHRTERDALRPGFVRRYHALRKEVAERYNERNYRFLPPPVSYETWTPDRWSAMGSRGHDFRWYR